MRKKLNKKSSFRSLDNARDLRPTFKEEKKLWKKGYKFVIGVDEVGRGAFAGPVTVGAVIFPVNFKSEFLSHINDSKVLSPDKRSAVSPLIKKHLIYSISTVSEKHINKLGIGKATEMAFRKSVSSIMKKVLCIESINKEKYLIHNTKCFLLVDGFHIKNVSGIGLRNQKAIIKGDKKSFSIAAASIIAKVHRDNLMVKLAQSYPEYGFEIHKGYGTKMHRDKIKKHGLSEVHRTIFCRNI
jgi:ribonuclease HII